MSDAYLNATENPQELISTVHTNWWIPSSGEVHVLGPSLLPHLWSRLIVRIQWADEVRVLTQYLAIRLSRQMLVVITVRLYLLHILSFWKGAELRPGKQLHQSVGSSHERRSHEQSLLRGASSGQPCLKMTSGWCVCYAFQIFKSPRLGKRCCHLCEKGC